MSVAPSVGLLNEFLEALLGVGARSATTTSISGHIAGQSCYPTAS